MARTVAALLIVGAAASAAWARECYPGPSECLGTLHRDQSYGASAEEMLDLYVPQAAGGPYPLVVFVHGGGFVGGDKARLWPGLVKALLAGKYAVASVNYRLAPRVRYPDPMLDVVRSLAFLRQRAAGAGFSAERVVLTGGSAGGAIALWIALRNDPAAGAIAGVIGVNAQTTYDPREISAVFDTRRYPGFLPQLFGVSRAQLEGADEGLRRMFREASPATHLDARDPPVTLIYASKAGVLRPDAAPQAYLHDARFGEYLKSKADAVGADVRLRIGETPGSETFNRVFVEELERFLPSARGARAPR